MRILWMSRHAPLQSQLAELERLFGSVEVVQDPRPFDSADDIVTRFRVGGYDDIVVVAPLSVIDQLVRRGIRPLWAEMEQIAKPAHPDPTREVEAAGRWYRFRRFRRVRAVTIEFEDL